MLKGIFNDLIRTGGKKQIVTTRMEHPCVKNTCQFLEELGAEIVYIPANCDGIIDLDPLRGAIDSDRPWYR